MPDRLTPSEALAALANQSSWKFEDGPPGVHVSPELVCEWCEQSIPIRVGPANALDIKHADTCPVSILAAALARPMPDSDVDELLAAVRAYRERMHTPSKGQHELWAIVTRIDAALARFDSKDKATAGATIGLLAAVTAVVSFLEEDAETHFVCSRLGDRWDNLVAAMLSAQQPARPTPPGEERLAPWGYALSDSRILTKEDLANLKTRAEATIGEGDGLSSADCELLFDYIDFLQEADYEVIIDQMRRVPLTWLPAILAEAVALCAIKPVFTAGSLIGFCKAAEMKAKGDL